MEGGENKHTAAVSKGITPPLGPRHGRRSRLVCRREPSYKDLDGRGSQSWLANVKESCRLPHIPDVRPRRPPRHRVWQTCQRVEEQTLPEVEKTRPNKGCEQEQRCLWLRSPHPRGPDREPPRQQRHARGHGMFCPANTGQHHGSANTNHWAGLLHRRVGRNNTQATPGSAVAAGQTKMRTASMTQL